MLAIKSMGGESTEAWRAVLDDLIRRGNTSKNRRSRTSGIEFGRTLAEIAADKGRTYEYLLRVSMIASLRWAQELG